MTGQCDRCWKKGRELQPVHKHGVTWHVCAPCGVWLLGRMGWREGRPMPFPVPGKEPVAAAAGGGR